jgi:sugar phosphate isomerase/epimerase
MRNVLILVALVGSALAACAAPVQDSADGGPMLAVRVMSYGKFQDGALKHLQDLGVHYVFLAVPAAADVDATMRDLAAHGLKPVVLRGNTDLSKESSVDELATQLATCEKMGVHYMFLSAKRNDAPKEVVCERLRRAGDIAGKHGVMITLETHPDLGTNGDVHLETMKAINNPHVRVNFDTANITYYNRGADSVAELKKVLDFLGTIEFKDHNGEFETWNFPVVGKGMIEFPAIMAILKERGYQGPVTIEFEGVKGVELTEEQTKQAITDSVAYVRTLGSFR